MKTQDKWIKFMISVYTCDVVSDFLSWASEQKKKKKKKKANSDAQSISNGWFIVVQLTISIMSEVIAPTFVFFTL